MVSETTIFFSYGAVEKSKLGWENRGCRFSGCEKLIYMHVYILLMPPGKVSYLLTDHRINDAQ